MTTDAPPAAAKTSHVNMMVDTVVANLPAEGLRSIIRSQLATTPAFTSFFIDSAQRYLCDTNKAVGKVFEYKHDSAGTPRPVATAEYGNVLRRIRAMVGSGLVSNALPRINEILEKTLALEGWDHGSEWEEELIDSLSELEGDVVQSVTAIQKVLVARGLTEAERELVLGLAEALKKCKTLADEKEAEDLFERGLESVESLLS
ncbi:uncharacterized protein J3D65DRAFT_679788 [Phyllosticta citribraziliensis]|uniref:Uncharacterized protein n=1 Tax=Phyllosticta citribraziliensis TaxID=989973 RepID=A0ABR1LI02_9PEZI